MPATLLFDFDGTLVDSIELILSSARHAFAGFPGRAPTDAEWRAGIGRPLLTMFREFVDDEDEVQRLVTRYREHQAVHHDRLVRPYEGIVPLIHRLSERGHPMAVVTSKPDALALRGLELVGLVAAIPVVVGCDSCTMHKPHPEPVERALSLLGSSPRQALFVGDSPHDIEAGRGAGVWTIGVTWGAFTRAEMVEAGADVVVDDVPGLALEIDRFEPLP